MKLISLVFLLLCLVSQGFAQSREDDFASKIDRRDYDPATLIWLDSPAAKWSDAIPVGNGRLGGMIFGGVNEEQIQLNEDTYWTGGPYSTVVKGGYKYLPQVQDLVFKGKYKEAQAVFGRHLMGYPVEQQKYQSLANLYLFFKAKGKTTQYKRWLNLATGTATVQFILEDITYKREVFASAPNQVIAIRLTASKPGSISFTANLRGVRNQQHSDYATDYFRMDSVGNDGLQLTGKSADYMGLTGKLKYEAQLKAVADGGIVKTAGTDLVISNANAVTLYFTAATNFVNYKDVTADEHARVAGYLEGVNKITFNAVKDSAVADYQRLFKRVILKLPTGINSWLPTDQRLANCQVMPDPALAALAYQFGRYVLISSSRPGTQAANLQGIWNNDMNPPWDAKYTTNINTEMNYWPVESANLAECAVPFIDLMKDITDQGTQVARENYNCRGWVLHQNTDLWRVAAPMDGPTWGTFTTAGAWMCDELWDHYQYTGDKKYLADIYPVIKGSVVFFMDFLVLHPNGKWLVTNPSSSPENFTGNPGNGPYFDETTGSMLPGTTICAGSSIDMEILSNLFSNYNKAGKTLGVDEGFALTVAQAKAKLRPPLIGRNGTLQEWTEDWPQLEKNHRHSSPMYGLYPGSVFSLKDDPEITGALKKLLVERGDGTSGWSRAWKTAIWARLREGNHANEVLKGYFKEQAFPQLFAKGGSVMQVDGTLGETAAISEMLVQSNRGTIDLLPALPADWPDGHFDGVCTIGAFELDIQWVANKIKQVKILSKRGGPCRYFYPEKLTVTMNGKKVPVVSLSDGSISFNTREGSIYVLK